MCGIVGYVGPRDGCEIVLGGLKGLEYRGYDSAGVALLDSKGRPELLRQVGPVDGLRKLIRRDWNDKSPLAIGHTRWATHGQPSVVNAHPHGNSDQTIFVVHNGIIENYLELRDKLIKKGYKFASETDSEVVPHLIDLHQKRTGSFEKAFAAALAEVRGAYAIVALSVHQPKKLLAARLGSPLVVGVGSKECILASDPSAILQHTKEVVYIQDDEMVIVSAGTYKITHLKHGHGIKRGVERLDFDAEKAELGDHPHFMIKEIFEAPETIRMASLGRVNSRTHTIKLGGLESVSEQLRSVNRIVIVACGTASFAGMIGEYLIEELAGIPAELQIGSEFKYRAEPFSPGTAMIVISQSGETADTIAAINKAHAYGCLCLGVVNAIGSSVARLTDAGVYCHSGPEQSVASTKAFMSQVLVLIEIALFIGHQKSPLHDDLLKEIEALPAKAEAVLAQADAVKRIAKKYKNAKDFLCIGRRYSYPVAMEAALKLKECTLIHAEGFAAGEMKHGPLALIDEHFPTLALAGDGPMFEKTVSNMQEIRTRHGKIVAVATEGNRSIARHADDIIYIPKTMEQTEPILQAIVVQLFAYYIAVEKAINVDRPRNLAKSVTVE